jgi:hypothetical protein
MNIFIMCWDHSTDFNCSYNPEDGHMSGLNMSVVTMQQNSTHKTKVHLGSFLIHFIHGIYQNYTPHSFSF